VNERKYRAETTGPRIDQFLRSVLKCAGFRLSYEIADAQNPRPEFENPEVIIRFSGPDVELLLNNRAELLLALEHLTMEGLRMPPEDHTRVCFDAEDYRMLRIEELRLSAGAAAEKVRHTGVPFSFNPMSSRERRIVHLALRDETGVRSESSGVGSHRQVVVYPEGVSSAAQAAPLGPAGPQYSTRRRRR
jgi:spoIIIJ-associated protein